MDKPDDLDGGASALARGGARILIGAGFLGDYSLGRGRGIPDPPTGTRRSGLLYAGCMSRADYVELGIGESYGLSWKLLYSDTGPHGPIFIVHRAGGGGGTGYRGTSSGLGGCGWTRSGHGETACVMIYGELHHRCEAVTLQMADKSIVEAEVFDPPGDGLTGIWVAAVRGRPTAVVAAAPGTEMVRRDLTLATAQSNAFDGW